MDYDAYIAKLDSVGEAILKWADPKSQFRGYTDGWPFTDFPTAFNIALAYLLFVFLGTMIMKAGVPAIDPYPIKFIYNVSQIMLCAYMTIEAALLAYRNDYSILPCNLYDTKSPPIANVLWLFYVSKIWDFWDTIFIVLGKKWRQLSFLHVYHHTTIFLFYWLNSHVYYDSDIYLTIVLNGFIHTVMYTYYCTSGMMVWSCTVFSLILFIISTVICMHTKVPETGKSLPIWWKSSLTMLQLIQFVTMMTQGSYLLVTQCPRTSLRVVAAYVVYILSLFILFAQFFMASYIKPSKKGKKIKAV